MGKFNGTVARCLTLDRQAVALLNELTPTRTSHGRTLSALVYAEVARR